MTSDDIWIMQVARRGHDGFVTVKISRLDKFPLVKLDIN